MIERDGALSIRRQCALLGISRSSVYYTPRGENPENLALMRRMDELSLQSPFYGSRQMARHLGREGVPVGRHRVRRLMRLMGLEALYRKPHTSSSQPSHRIYPYLLRVTTSSCSSCSGSSTASRNCMKPGTPPTSSGGHRCSPSTNAG